MLTRERLTVGDRVQVPDPVRIGVRQADSVDGTPGPRKALALQLL